MSGVVVDPTSMNVRVKFGDSRSDFLEIYDCLKCVTEAVAAISTAICTVMEAAMYVIYRRPV